MVRAQQTKQWRGALPACGEAVYDEERIAASVERVVLDEARWRAYFARNGLAPLRLIYEGVVRNPQDAVHRIASGVGVEAGFEVDAAASPLEIQRDDATVAWRERFLNARGDLSFLDRPTHSL